MMNLDWEGASVYPGKYSRWYLVYTWRVMSMSVFVLLWDDMIRKGAVDVVNDLHLTHMVITWNLANQA